MHDELPGGWLCQLCCGAPKRFPKAIHSEHVNVQVGSGKAEVLGCTKVGIKRDLDQSAGADGEGTVTWYAHVGNGRLVVLVLLGDSEGCRCCITAARDWQALQRCLTTMHMRLLRRGGGGIEAWLRRGRSKFDVIAHEPMRAPHLPRGLHQLLAITFETRHVCGSVQVDLRDRFVCQITAWRHQWDLLKRIDRERVETSLRSVRLCVEGVKRQDVWS